MAITINGSGTITGVSVGGLPDGIVDTDMLATDAVTAAKIGSLPSGSILQVVQTYKTDVDSTASTTEADISGFSRTITPIAAGSSFLIISDLGLSNNTIAATAILNLYRGTTLIGPSPATQDASLSVYTGGTNASFSYGHNFIDTPTYTLGDTLTYKWRWYVDNTNMTCFINQHSGNTNYSMTSGITVMEVAA